MTKSKSVYMHQIKCRQKKWTVFRTLYFKLLIWTQHAVCVRIFPPGLLYLVWSPLKSTKLTSGVVTCTSCRIYCTLFNWTQEVKYISVFYLSAFYILWSVHKNQINCASIALCTLQNYVLYIPELDGRTSVHVRLLSDCIFVPQRIITQPSHCSELRTIHFRFSWTENVTYKQPPERTAYDEQGNWIETSIRKQ